MDGLITSRDVLLNFRTIWREFGAVVALSCIAALIRRKRTTFLDVACRLG
ncbi:MAG TPA: hypothetical protein VGK67_25325 [Myxococcales bacterium]